ncbi:hypothetical protein ABK040_011019 [Willaertia magna]
MDTTTVMNKAIINDATDNNANVVKPTSMNTSVIANKPKKKKGRHRKLDTLTYETIREYFKYTQSQAAKKLGVSVSTLKRKFYSLGYESRWPYTRTVTPKKKKKKAAINASNSDDDEIAGNEIKKRKVQEEEEHDEEEENDEFHEESNLTIDESDDEEEEVEEETTKLTVEPPLQQYEKVQNQYTNRSFDETSCSQATSLSMHYQQQQLCANEEEDNNNNASQTNNKPNVKAVGFAQSSFTVEFKPINNNTAVLFQPTQLAQSSQLSNVSNNTTSSITEQQHINNTSYNSSNRIFSEQSQFSNYSLDINSITQNGCSSSSDDDDLLAASMLCKFKQLQEDKKPLSNNKAINNSYLPPSSPSTTSSSSTSSIGFSGYNTAGFIYPQQLKKQQQEKMLPPLSSAWSFNPKFDPEERFPILPPIRLLTDDLE